MGEFGHHYASGAGVRVDYWGNVRRTTPLTPAAHPPRG